MHNDCLWWTLVLLLLLAVGGGQTPDAQSDSSAPTPAKNEQNKFAGSKSCRDCHENFNKLWSTYWHGLSMQPYSYEFANKQLTGQQSDVKIGDYKYRAEIGEGQGWVLEQGPNGERRYPILHVIGGKNIYYFLTPLERGRLQVLPVAYNVNERAWYDTTAGSVSHFLDRRDEALPWTDRQYTFNIACFNCHVSRLATNYDLETDTYHTTWGEPGISCETCHGPSGEHNRLMQAGIKGRSAEEMKIIINRDFTHEQLTDLCVTCHAKIIPLSTNFAPGQKFFDHYDLITLEHADYYPDGRDLGENYTYTSWLMSPCLKSRKLDCKYCHTPAGRFRWTEYQGYQTCMPCHEQYVKKPEEHGHHLAGSKGNECVACHMPKTQFAGRARSDHSMRPPSPAATIAFGSPNACNNCHADRDAAWSDEWVRKWYKRDYQAEVLTRAELIDAARKNQWDRLPEMLAELTRGNNDQVYRNSLVRLLRQCNDPRKWNALLQAIKDPSPLVRASAASALGDRIDRKSLESLLAAAGDQSRIVRIRAAMALAAIHPEKLQNPAHREALEKAVEEFKIAMQARGDDWASHANLGNFYMQRRDFPQAIKCFENARRLEPRMIELLINTAMAYSNMQQNDRAEACLLSALETEPANAAANLNLGLLLAEDGKTDEAEKALRIAIKSNPRLVSAAYNLGVILARKNNMTEAIGWCRKAWELRPDEAKYAQGLALYLHQDGDEDESIQVLRKAIGQNPLFLDGYVLLSEIYEDRGDRSSAVSTLREAIEHKEIPPTVRQELESKIRSLETSEPDKKTL